MDIEQHEELLDYLKRAKRVATDERPLMRTLAGGVSNRTVLVERSSGESWVIKQALAKLRVSVDWFSDPARIEREATGLRWLVKLAPPGTITPLVFEDRAHHLLAMRAVPQPHDNWKTLLLGGEIILDYAEQFGRLLGTIHHRADELREQVAPAFDDQSFFESLRIEPYYSFTATQIPAAAPFIKELIDETRRLRITLVHGDYSPKNILVHHGKLMLLDHEVVHFGDPAFDIGFSLTHLISKAHHLAQRRDDLMAATLAYWTAYLSTVANLEWTAKLEDRAVRHALACLLARVAGRSPLEYLSERERTRQQMAALDLMRKPPATVINLLHGFMQKVNNHADH